MEIIRRRYRVLAHIDVTMRRIDPIAAAESWHDLIRPRGGWMARLGISKDDYIARPQRLFDGLMRDEAALDAWLRCDAEAIVVDGELYDYRGDVLAHEILAPVIPGLPAPHRAYFEDVCARDLFYEAAESFFAACGADVLAMTTQAIAGAAPVDAYMPVNQRYRVSIDADAVIREIETESARTQFEQIRACEEIPLGVTLAEYVEHQRELTAAVLRNEAVLDAWLRDVVLMQVLDRGALHLRTCISDEEILRPVIERLSPDDQAYFQRAIREEVFWELLGDFREALWSEIRSVAILAVPEVHTPV